MLAGGRSRRLGGMAKGLERVGTERIIDRVAKALGLATNELVLVANDPGASAWLPSVRVIPDLQPGLGGLAGVEAALSLGKSALVVAWDMPFVTGALLRALVDAGLTDDADAVVPASPSPYGFEPFCAFYSARIRAPLSDYLRSGGGAAHDFLRGIPRLRVLSVDEVAPFGNPKQLFFSVNSPEDLEQARAMVTATK